MSVALNGFDEASALASLITNSLKNILDEYKAAGEMLPGLMSTSVGPFDLPEKASVGLVRNVRIVEAACSQLAALVSPPGKTVVNRGFAVGLSYYPVQFQLITQIYQHHESSCYNVIINHKIADLLVGKPDGVHINELAKESGLDSNKLCRILRCLATNNVFVEVKPCVFANNRLSIKLHSEDPVSSFVALSGDEWMKASVYLSETLSDPEKGPSVSPNDAPFARAFNANLFDFYNENPQKGRAFNQSMVGWGEVNGKGMLGKVYPWNTIKDGATVCDVGGGNGHVMMTLLQNHPHLKAIVQDQPAVLEDGKKFWEAEYSEAIEKKRVDFIATDFFKEAPVAGADFYHIRHILHDWSDDLSAQILGNVRKAMRPGSKLLIHEQSPRSASRDDSGKEILDQAPEPLVANFGAGMIKTYYTDILMMALLNSMERSAEDFTKIAETVGLKFTKVYDAGEVALVEFEIA